MASEFGLKPWRLGAVLLALAASLSALPAKAAEPTFPELTGRVVDDAQLLGPDVEEELTNELKALEHKSSDQLVVVTLPSLQGYPIEDYGYQLGRHWGIGTAKLNNGVLLIVAPNEHKVRIEVGYGLEGRLTNEICALILQDDVLPHFRKGDFAGGVTQGVEGIIRVLEADKDEWQPLSPEQTTR